LDLVRLRLILGFHQNRAAGFPRPIRKSSRSPAVKFAPANRCLPSAVANRQIAPKLYA